MQEGWLILLYGVAGPAALLLAAFVFFYLKAGSDLYFEQQRVIETLTAGKIHQSDQSIKEERRVFLFNLGARAASILEKINGSLRKSYSYNVEEHRISEIRALFIDFRKAGFAIPDVNSLEPLTLVTAARIYCGTIYPYLKSGHEEEAKEKAGHLTERITGESQKRQLRSDIAAKRRQ